MTGRQQVVVLLMSLLLFVGFLISQPGQNGSALSPGPGGKLSTIDEENDVVLVELERKGIRRGIVEIPSGTSVPAALEKMGGIEGSLSLAQENSSLQIKENSRIRILAEKGGKGQVVLEPLPASTMKILGVPVSVNTATIDQLNGLPGIGPQTAQAILAHRERNGKFQNPDELLQVPGIGPKKLAALRPYILIR